MKNRISLGIFALLFSIMFAGPAVAGKNMPWEKVQAESMTVDVNGQARSIEPSCAMGTPYSFYFKPGKSRKVAIFFNGGGACWNDATCLQSLQPEFGQGAYVPVLDVPHNQIEYQGGMMDGTNPQNPYRDWSILFLPYCTGDVHIGSNDQSYGPAAAAQTIHHRGFDNFLYARQWLKQRLAGKKGKRTVSKVLVAGSSAGAYGAAFNFPYIKQAFPKAKGYLLADSGNGVFVDEVIENAMHLETASWRIDANLPTWVPGIETLAAQSPETYIVTLYSSLANHYPKDRFAAFTSAWDATQVFFFNIMLNPTDISQWPAVSSAFQIWPAMMQSFAYQLAALDNYRFYIAPGCEHTLLRDAGFYSTDEVDGVSFLDWMQGLTGKGRHKKDWRNIHCSDCPPPTAEEIGTCLN